MTGIEAEINKIGFEGNLALEAFSPDKGRGLSPQEVICLDLVPASYWRSVLDIGIGGGRTTAVLPAKFTHYVGFDYAAPLVKKARSSFPSLDIHLLDARSFDLGQKFDCLFFSFNGIDYVSPEDRPLVLERVRKHTIDGGYFIYSTHNLAFKRVPFWYNNFFVAEFLPTRWVNRLPNRLKNFWKQRRNEEAGWAVINDSGLRFGLLTVYVDIEKERKRLHQFGFEAIAAIGNNKTEIGFDQDDGWVYIVAKKTA
jgi:SAM-dependent methyltransferase